MKNKGFSIIECVFCLLLLSSVTIGIITVILNINYQEKERLYKVELYANFHTLFNVMELGPNPKSSIKEVYKEFVIEKEDNLYFVNIPLVYEHNNNEIITYQITFAEFDEYYVVSVNVINVPKKYQELNHEVISQRFIEK